MDPNEIQQLAYFRLADTQPLRKKWGLGRLEMVFWAALLLLGLASGQEVVILISLTCLIINMI